MTVASETEELLTVAQFMAEVQISRTTEYFWRRDGIGPRFIRIGKGPKAAIRYPRSAVTRWLRENGR